MFAWVLPLVIKVQFLGSDPSTAPPVVDSTLVHQPPHAFFIPIDA